MITRSITEMEPVDQVQIIKLVREFDNFTEDNDPYKEHDFGSFDYKGEEYYWKIDYYDNNLEHLSPDPSDETVTKRVLTIMMAKEY